MVQNVYVPDGSKWNDDDIVISGISARLPNCDSVEEFQNNLLAKVDLITDEPRRFQKGLYGAIERYGLLKKLDKFDAEFFNIHPKQAERMDPQIRNLLEVAYEATVDAGLHPDDLRGTKTGVVVGVASSETQDKWSQRPGRINGYEYTGCTRTMFANRVSYFLDIKGPSYSIDTASSTTLVAFQQAYDMIRDGVCDACFVCGTDLVLNPCVCLMFQCLNMLSPEGKCKAFDIKGDGYVRSEGAIAVLLQKAKDAKRVYANVLAAGSNCDGYKDEGITFPSCDMQISLFRRVAEIAEIDPKTIDFMEAHGSATRVGDPQEMNAVTEVFTRGREQPLRCGSVKSNMGHGEPASALSAIIKVCVAMECEILPPNLHYNIPNPDIPALLNGQLKVVTEPTPWEGGIVAVNSFGVGGANGHALLLSNKKQKQCKHDEIPRLVCVSGVTKSSVATMLSKIKSLPIDPDFYALLNNIHRKNIEGHVYRGFMLMIPQNTLRIAHVPKKHRKTSLCFILSGLETTWTSVNPDTMKMKAFQDLIAASEKELSTVMENVNLNLILINLRDERSPINLVVGVTVLQICIIEILRTLEIIPDRTIGINIGEIASGYANGVYTLGQAMLLAYHTGSVLQQFYYHSAVLKTNIPSRESNPPSDVSIVVKNGSNGTLFSGPKLSMDKFMQRLKRSNHEVFASDNFVVDVIGIIRKSGCASKLGNEFKKVLTNTTKWSAEDFVTVLTRAKTLDFETGGPSIVLEIGPHSDIVKNLPSFAFMEENLSIVNILQSIGQLFNVGLQPQIQHLYPQVEFPVPHGTPMIQSMIEWDHSQTWDVVSFAPKDNRTAGELDVVVDFDKEEFKFLRGNELCGEHVLPKAFYIYLLWKTTSTLQNKMMTDFPLIIQNIFFVRETLIPAEATLKFTIIVLATSNKFEIRESGQIVVSGEVHIPTPDILSKEQIPADMVHFENSTVDTEINDSDIYRFLSIYRYFYNNTFKSISSFNFASNVAKVQTEKWIPFMEAYLQIFLLNRSFESHATSVISFVRKMVIIPQKYRSDEVTVHYNKNWNALISDVIEIRGMQMKEIPFGEMKKPYVMCSKFVPFISNIENAAESSIMLALDNFLGCNDLKIVGLLDNSADLPLTSLIKNINPLLHANTTLYCNDTPETNRPQENITVLRKNIRNGPVDNNCHLVIAKNLLHDPIALQHLMESLRTNGCLLLEEDHDDVLYEERENIKMIARLRSSNKTYHLLKKVNPKIRNSPRVITISGISDCVQKLQHIPDDNVGLLVVARKSFDVGGIIPFIKHLSAQSQSKNLRVMFLEDEHTSSEFSLKNPLYADQLQKNYPINVYKNGVWGTYLTTSFYHGTSKPIENACTDQFHDNGETTFGLIAASAGLCNSQVDSQKVVCQIHYATVTKDDVQMYQKNKKHFGLEFSGYEGRRRVFGLVAGSALAKSVVADKDYLWTVPETWTLEEAVTIPYAYALSYYGLVISGNLQKGSSVLIMGFNDVAIAAISIALNYDCETFLLLRDQLQIPTLKKLFPQIDDMNVIISGENHFHLNILQRTGEKGVQTFFNTQPEENCELQSCVFSLAENGKYLYINYGHYLEENLGCSGSMRCLTFHRLTPACFLDNTNVNVRRKISEFIADGLSQGVIQPLPYSTFSDTNTINNLGSVLEEYNTSKTVIRIGKYTNEISEETPTHFDDTKSYVIIVGNTDFGVYTTAYLIAQGMRKVVLVHTAPGLKNSHLIDFLLTKVNNIAACDISRVTMNNFSIEDCETLLQNANQSAPLGGIFDFTQLQTPEMLGDGFFETAMKQKVTLLSNMDVVTRKSFPYLPFFVSFSLVELEHGQPSHNLLPFTNGIIQTLMRNRRDLGFSATLIQWGQVGESSGDILFNDLKLSEAVTSPQSVMSCLQTMHQLLRTSEPVVSSFLGCEYIATREDSKVDAIVEGVAKFLGIKDPNSILPTVTMLELGLDSLIGTDIQQFLEINYGVILNTQEIRELTFEKLKKLAESL